ncbi:MAG: NRDE family protein [Halioglobus sp.]|nr:NRDE family protein [Halioglobus sp.]
MCLLIFAHQPGSTYPLVVAANRDEFHNRPTAPAQFWQDAPDLLAGRDLEAGGTWMGVTATGRFAAITNFRDPDRTAPAPRSRGELPTDFLNGTARCSSYLEGLAARGTEYAGFNLLVGDGDELWYCSNVPADGAEQPRQLKPGIYGLSNALLDTPWPKVTLGKAALTGLLAGDRLTHRTLAEVVGDTGLAEPGALHAQGLRGDMDQLLSAQFIVTPGYGTRSRTTLWRDAGGATHWREQSFNPQGELTGEQRFAFAPREGD